MDAFECIHTRRSIRSFTDQPVPEDLIEELLKAAMAAPSARNEQPWHFVIISEREKLDSIPGFHPYARMAREAQLGILVCGDLELEKSKGNWPVDCAAATQNLLLAARALDLGAVWCGVYPREERMKPFAELCGLPENIRPFAFIPIGWPAHPSGRKERYKPERVHYSHWGNHKA